MRLTITEKLLMRGPYSLDITIPAWWAKGHNLKAGDLVQVVAEEDKITILPIGDVE
ncbi:MAG: AbrB/MazE/SpoVT family DNA-binding domain-containing protein [Nitrososphaerota archaeon]